MSTTEKKPLFELTAAELEEELSGMFKAFSANHPIRYEVGSALIAAQAATQRLALRAFEQVGGSGSGNGSGYEALGPVFEAVEMLNGFLLEGNPSRIDLVLWDAAGYIHGWFVNERGHPEVLLGSCPEVVAKLAAALQALATYEQDWRAVLERRAANLASLVRLSREKAELQARAKVESRSWLRKLISRTSVERELLSLGFR
ncbi:MAG: hypothetical protein KGJ74_00950 [Betaproteobacteria bacterium]|nr:hypothetical protein [Betaproteobacteria bacterium]